MLVLAALSSALAVAVPSIPATYTADVVAVTGGTASVRSTIGRCNEFWLPFENLTKTHCTENHWILQTTCQPSPCTHAGVVLLCRVFPRVRRHTRSTMTLRTSAGEPTMRLKVRAMRRPSPLALALPRNPLPWATPACVERLCGVSVGCAGRADSWCELESTTSVRFGRR
jgi:hypothetical protein